MVYFTHSFASFFQLSVLFSGGDANMSMLGLGNIPEHAESPDPNETQNEVQRDLMPEFRIPTISIEVLI